MKSRHEANIWHRSEHCSRRSVRSVKLAALAESREIRALEAEVDAHGIDSQMLHARIQSSFSAFLQIELDVGFTFAKLARSHHHEGAKLQFEKARRHANFATETVRRFENLIQDDAGRLEITGRCAELEIIVAQLYSLDPLSFD